MEWVETCLAKLQLELERAQEERVGLEKEHQHAAVKLNEAISRVDELRAAIHAMSALLAGAIRVEVPL